MPIRSAAARTVNSDMLPSPSKIDSNHIADDPAPSAAPVEGGVTAIQPR